MAEIEKWKSLDFLGYPNYEVSNFGKVKSLNYLRSGKEKILKQGKYKDGYMLVGLWKDGEGKTFLVHKLVALAFIPNPFNLPQINHKDENKENNHVDNLEFCTAKHNTNYGTRNKRLSESKEKPILQYALDGSFIRDWESIKQASKELNIHQCNITSCCKGRLKTCGNFIWKYK